jgi:hypothetical protein
VGIGPSFLRNFLLSIWRWRELRSSRMLSSSSTDDLALAAAAVGAVLSLIVRCAPLLTTGCGLLLLPLGLTEQELGL